MMIIGLLKIITFTMVIKTKNISINRIKSTNKKFDSNKNNKNRDYNYDNYDTKILFLVQKRKGLIQLLGNLTPLGLK